MIRTYGKPVKAKPDDDSLQSEEFDKLFGRKIFDSSSEKDVPSLFKATYRHYKKPTLQTSFKIRHVRGKHLSSVSRSKSNTHCGKLFCGPNNEYSVCNLTSTDEEWKIHPDTIKQKVKRRKRKKNKNEIIEKFTAFCKKVPHKSKLKLRQASGSSILKNKSVAKEININANHAEHSVKAQNNYFISSTPSHCSKRPGSDLLIKLSPIERVLLPSKNQATQKSTPSKESSRGTESDFPNKFSMIEQIMIPSKNMAVPKDYVRNGYFARDRDRTDQLNSGSKDDSLLRDVITSFSNLCISSPIPETFSSSSPALPHNQKSPLCSTVENKVFANSRLSAIPLDVVDSDKLPDILSPRTQEDVTDMKHNDEINLGYKTISPILTIYPIPPVFSKSSPPSTIYSISPVTAVCAIPAISPSLAFTPTSAFPSSRVCSVSPVAAKYAIPVNTCTLSVTPTSAFPPSTVCSLSPVTAVCTIIEMTPTLSVITPTSVFHPLTVCSLSPVTEICAIKAISPTFAVTPSSASPPMTTEMSPTLSVITPTSVFHPLTVCSMSPVAAIISTPAITSTLSVTPTSAQSGMTVHSISPVNARSATPEIALTLAVTPTSEISSLNSSYISTVSTMSSDSARCAVSETSAMSTKPEISPLNPSTTTESVTSAISATLVECSPNTSTIEDDVQINSELSSAFNLDNVTVRRRKKSPDEISLPMRPSLILQPGKQWRRSLSILKNIPDLDVTDCSYKGKGWAIRVEEVLELQLQDVRIPGDANHSYCSTRLSTSRLSSTASFQRMDRSSTNRVSLVDPKHYSHVTLPRNSVTNKRNSRRISHDSSGDANNSCCSTRLFCSRLSSTASFQPRINRSNTNRISFGDPNNYSRIALPRNSAAHKRITCSIRELETVVDEDENEECCSNHELEESDIMEDIEEYNISLQSSESPARSEGHNCSLTCEDLILKECAQEAPIAFSVAFSNEDLQDCHKLGEGVYGEVFALTRESQKGDQIYTVLKIIPIEGDRLVNGEKQMQFEEIFSEVCITKLLSALQICCDGSQTRGFAELYNCWLLKGQYPERLITLWNEFDKTKGSDNDSPVVFEEDQLYMGLEMMNGGAPLESYTFSSARQAYSVFQQVCFTLAVAEECLEFEHRDLHWGNILVSKTKEKHSIHILKGRKYELKTYTVNAKIIDFTLSRLALGDSVVYKNLATDEDLFNAEGDYQFEIYRLMRRELENKWETFAPKTNVYWLHYLSDKLVHTAKYSNTVTKLHSLYIQKLQALSDDLKSCKSAVEVALAMV